MGVGLYFKCLVDGFYRNITDGILFSLRSNLGHVGVCLPANVGLCVMRGEGGQERGEELIDSKQGFIILHPVTYQDCSAIRIVRLQTCLPLRTIYIL